MRRGSGHLARWIAFWLMLSPAAGALAQGRFIDDVRITADGEQATIELEFACDMRFVADTPTSGGAILEVRVAPFENCARHEFGAAGSSESFVPVGADAAHLLLVEYDSLGLGDSVVLLSFDQPLSYTIRQGASLREVEVVVDLSTASSRQPLSVRVVEPTTTADYIINLQSTREPVGSEAVEGLVLGADERLYVSQIRVDGVLWHRLRIGFFGTEADAKAALETLAGRFPRAWIGRAEPAEIERAVESSLPTGQRLLSFENVEEEASPVAPRATAEPLDAEAVPSAMANARQQLLDGNNAGAIELYGRLVATPGEHRAEAIEFLGLAYERSGDPVRAREAYQRFLREFPDGPEHTRVEQRLQSIAVAQAAPREALRDAGTAAGPAWEFSTGLAQYYRRDDNQFVEDEPIETTQSALLTDLDVSLKRSGQRIDTLARLSFSQYHDLLADQNADRSDWNRVSYAYVDIAESQQQWALRVGRQSLHTFGVLGRFDGAHFSYGVGQDKRLHVMAGYPVESTRDSVASDRTFAGVAMEFIDLIGSWDLSAFVNAQTMDGVEARQAVGMEARYFDERRSVTAMLDYDVDFDELNTVLLLGTLRLDNRLTLSALVDRRLSPILTTRNALIGQPVESLEEMLLVWSQDEVRRLALDRTAASRTVTLGVAAPLGDRLQLNFDLTSAEIDPTPASGGVAASPGTGPQHFYSASLVGTGLMAQKDVNIFNFRVGDQGAAQTRLVTWDGRFPVGRRLRINPRIRLALWESAANGRRRETLSPSLRLLVTARNRYRFELEVGRDEIRRTTAETEQDLSARFVNIGYRASF